MYSAYVEGGEHEAQLPVQLRDPSLRTKGAKFASSDPTIATVSDTADGATITVKRDGTVNITATLDDVSGAATLTITKFTQAQWALGQARFSKSELAIVPATPGGPITVLAALGSGGTRNANGACTTCHTEQARTLRVENTPTQIAGYSDDQLVTIFTMGKKPDGFPQRTMIPAFAWGTFHAWAVTEEEKPGLIAFLRTQVPKPNPVNVDFGVMLCPGAVATASADPPLCDSNGNPVVIGLPGAASDASVPATDAGAPASDAG
jgi:hypothetical protein